MTARKRLVGVLLAASAFLAPTAAHAQLSEPIEPNLNWVFLLAIVTMLGFLAFLGFVALYYVLAVIARNRKFATTAVTVAAPATSPVAAPAPAPMPAAPAAPAPAAAAAPAAPAAPAP